MCYSFGFADMQALVYHTFLTLENTIIGMLLALWKDLGLAHHSLAVLGGFCGQSWGT